MRAFVFCFYCNTSELLDLAAQFHRLLPEWKRKWDSTARSPSSNRAFPVLPKPQEGFRASGPVRSALCTSVKPAAVATMLSVVLGIVPLQEARPLFLYFPAKLRLLEPNRYELQLRPPGKAQPGLPDPLRVGAMPLISI